MQGLESLWMIEERFFNPAAHLLPGLEMPTSRPPDHHLWGSSLILMRVGGSSGDMRDRPYPMCKDVAVLSLTGPLTKEGSWWYRGTSTDRFREMLSEADSDEGVGGVALLIDSPGGTAAGTAASGDAVAAFRKPIGTYVTDCCCSAALWIGSQADLFWANRTAPVGSIGTKMTLIDMSRMYENAGLKVKTYATGTHKAAGTPGMPILPEHDAEFQREINLLNEEFLLAVADGRKMDLDAVRAVADGRVHNGQAAIDLGLVDRIAGIDEFLAEMQNRASKYLRTQSRSSGPAGDAGGAGWVW